MYTMHVIFIWLRRQIAGLAPFTTEVVAHEEAHAKAEKNRTVIFVAAEKTALNSGGVSRKMV